jgi:hypothetical protein
MIEKKRAVIFVGYHYLSTPVYEALRDQLNDYEVIYLNTKDTVGHDTNKVFFQNNKFDDSYNFYQMQYEPLWNRGRPINTIRSKFIRVLKRYSFILSFPTYKKKVLNFVESFKPDLFIITTDMFITPRFLADELPDIPIFLIQPCYLDLWERPYLNKFSKKLVNVFSPKFFERQQYFGFEITRAKLLIWEPSSFDIYKKKGRNPILISNPNHIQLKNNSKHFRSYKQQILKEIKFANNKKTVSFYTAFYGDVINHGLEYQKNLENSIIDVINRIRNHYNIIIKIHPNEDLNYWRDVFKDFINEDILLTKNHGHKFKFMAASDIMIATNSYASVEATLLGVFTINFVPGIATIGEKFCSEFNKNCLMISYTAESLCEYLINISNKDLNYEDELFGIQQSIIGVENRQTVEEVINQNMLT